jgi:serine/threonine-protein kinase
MKVCPECGRSYADDAVVCAYDGVALSSGATTSWSDSGQAPPASGDVLGVYRILERIDEGGMGIIYRAEHVRLGRQVALKVLKTELAKRTDVVRRFFEEARAVNEIGHPNIVDIIDFIEVSDQSPPLVYMVMELLKGQDLGRRVRVDGPVPPEEAVHIACQVCDALIAVHRVKILHRDLKPENIYLAQTPEGAEKVKLLDFGVAKAFGERQKVRITEPGMAIGTPEFMAPEQILGKEMDERTDIYALGMVIYDMLCGSVAFQASKYGALMVAQVKEAPPPLSERMKDKKTVPPELELAVMRCLEKKPQDRFQNVKELKHALLSAMGLSFESLDGLPQTTASREVLVAVSGRPWLRVALGLTAVLALGIIAAVLLMGRPEAPSRKEEAAKPAVAGAKSAPDVTAPVDQTVSARAAPDLGVDASPAAAASKRPRRPPLARSRRPRARTKKKDKEKKEPRTKRKSSIETTLDPFAQ